MQIIRVKLVNSEKTKGCELAPVEVLKELRNLKSTQDFKEIDVSKLNLEEIHVDLDNIDEANHLIFENGKEIFEKNDRAFFIGGDNSINGPILKAFKKIEETPLLIVFDAHGNCKEGEWLKDLVEGGFLGSGVILVSSRNLDKGEVDFIKKEKITLIGMDVLRELEDVCDMVTERARNSSGFFVSIDINAVDPSFAPGTVSLEPGGLDSKDLIYFIKRLALLKNFRGASIFNINPDLDVNGMTVKLGAKLLGEMVVNNG